MPTEYEFEKSRMIKPGDLKRFHVFGPADNKPHPLIPGTPRTNTDTVTETIADLLQRKKAHDAEASRTGYDMALRYNEGKRQWSLMDYPATEEMIKVLEFGANKYARENWKKGFNMKKLYESTQRHIAALMSGETHDSESKCTHAGHVMCNGMFVAWYMLHPELQISDEEQEKIDKAKRK